MSLKDLYIKLQLLAIYEGTMCILFTYDSYSKSPYKKSIRDRDKIENNYEDFT